MQGTLRQKLQFRVDSVNDFLYLPLSPLYNKVYSCHVLNASLFTIYASVWYQELIYSELYVQSHSVFQCCGCFISFCVCALNSYTFQEYTYMHLILSEALANGAPVVRLYKERYPHCRLLNPLMFHTIGYYIKETSTVYPSMVECGRWRSACYIDVKEHVLRPVEENQSISIY
jgi:hypothetical protein